MVEKEDFGSKPAPEKKLKPWQRNLYIVGGTISLALGLIGIPVPLLPTTPFLLLSAWCYARSSERFYLWLINHRHLGKNIRNYREKGGVELKIKIWAISLLWITIILTSVFAVNLWWVRALLLVIATGVTIHIAWLKTLK